MWLPFHLLSDCSASPPACPRNIKSKKTRHYSVLIFLVPAAVEARVRIRLRLGQSFEYLPDAPVTDVAGFIRDALHLYLRGKCIP